MISKTIKTSVKIKQMLPSGWERTFYNPIVGREEVENHDTAAEALNKTKEQNQRYSETLNVNVVSVIEWNPYNRAGQMVVNALQ